MWTTSMGNRWAVGVSQNEGVLVSITVTILGVGSDNKGRHEVTSFLIDRIDTQKDLNHSVFAPLVHFRHLADGFSIITLGMGSRQ